MRRLVWMALGLGGCASVWGWNGAAQRRLIEGDEQGEVLKEAREGRRVVFVWRQGPYRYHKWFCNTGYFHDCTDDYIVDRLARSCSVAHQGPEQVVDCAGLRRDADLSRYVTW